MIMKFKIDIIKAEDLIYEVILDGESKENYTPEFRSKVIEVIAKIREEMVNE